MGKVGKLTQIGIKLMLFVSSQKSLFQFFSIMPFIPKNQGPS